MFSQCFLDIFNVEKQGENDHRQLQIIYQVKVGDLLAIYESICSPTCVSVLTDRRFKLAAVRLF